MPARDAAPEPVSLGLLAMGGTPSGCAEPPGSVGAVAGAGSPCRVCPQTWWCFSQSLCWQKEPQ